MKLNEAMSSDTGTIPAEKTVVHAAHMMPGLNRGRLIVPDDEHDLTGVLTDQDITMHLADGGNPASHLISQLLFEQRLVTIQADAPPVQALMTLTISGTRRLPL